MALEPVIVETVDYEYVRSVGAHGVHAHMQFDALLGSDREIWVGSDGSGLIGESRGPVDFFTEEGRTRWEAAGRPPLAHGRHLELFAPGCLPGARARRARIIQHPDGISAALSARGPLTLEAVSELLGEGVADAQFCQTVCEIARQLPGVQSSDELVDQIGRGGPGLAQTYGVSRIELIFSTDLSELLAYQHLFAEPVEFAPAGAVHSWSAFLERQIVPALPADVPPVPRRSGDPSRGRWFRIRPEFSISTGYDEDPLNQLAEMHAQGVLTDADYESAMTAHAWARFDDPTAAAWRELGLTPGEAAELTHAGHRPSELSARWRPTGIPADELAEWIGAGLSPSEAVDQRAQGVSTEDAAALRGFRRADRR